MLPCAQRTHAINLWFDCFSCQKIVIRCTVYTTLQSRFIQFDCLKSEFIGCGSSGLNPNAVYLLKMSILKTQSLGHASKRNTRNWRFSLVWGFDFHKTHSRTVTVRKCNCQIKTVKSMHSHHITCIHLHFTEFRLFLLFFLAFDAIFSTNWFR